MNQTLDLIAALALVGLAVGFLWRRYARSRRASGGTCGHCERCTKD